MATHVDATSDKDPVIVISRVFDAPRELVWRMLTATGTDDPLGGLLVGYATMIVALTTVFLGIKHYRDKVLGGAIKFLPAFGVGIGISTVACILYAIGWEISIANSSCDFTSWYSNYMVDEAKARGASAVELQKVIVDAKDFAEMYKNPFYRIPLTFVEMFPVGLLISLISAAVLRNSRVLPSGAAR